ncbi:MAG: endopeptidase La [Eubacteriales bacterium]
MIDGRKILPTVALRGMTVLPEMVIHFDVSRKKSVLAVEQAMREEQQLFLVAQRDNNTSEPEQKDVFEYGCVAEIKQIIKLPKDILRVLVVGRKRARLEELVSNQEYLVASVNILERDALEVEGAHSDTAEASEMENLESTQEASENRKIGEQAQIRELKELYATFVASNSQLKKDVLNQIRDINELEKLVDVVAGNCMLDYRDTQLLLEMLDVEDRYSALLLKIMDEIQINNIKESIHQKVKENVDKSQREFILREQLKVIREELGDDTTLTDADEFTKIADKMKATAEVKEKLKKEIKRFRNINNNSAENGVLRTYIETMIEMPWNKVTKDSHDLTYAAEILDSEHYGMEEVKERILEFLAVRTLTKKGHSPILCLVGPPGTGKTSIAKSLANAMKKQYVRISLGGVHDEAEIRGHRKTYVGAMPGRIANGIKQAGSKNPLMLLDEIDKVGTDHKGDAFAGLLEVLDGEQNMKFRDHYLEVPLDLSEVLFVATANSLQTIPRPLLDRMEIIEISSYTENEKVHIAKQHLIPKQLKAHGLTEKELSVSKAAIEKIARHYTKEAGVRQLERKVGAICRKVAREILETKKQKIRLTELNVEKYLGQEKYHYQMKNEKDEIGIVRGLAWTSVGGVTLQIEVNVMPGTGKVSLTGKLGDVMKESATAAISYIRSIGAAYEIEDNYFATHDIHVHIPEGAVPKDGPSAGITMATAILSAVTNKPVRADVAMTGEITLRGRVLAIGGLKEKLLAAKNAGIQTVLVPIENQRDITKITSEITKDIEIIPVTTMEEVYKEAFAN